MLKSIILPVGTSDIDGPDVIVLPWGPEPAEIMRKRVRTVRRLAASDPALSCLRYRAAEVLGFSSPGDDGTWLDKVNQIHMDNVFLGTRHTAEYFKKRWKRSLVEMPDPPRISIYRDGTVYFSGPVGLSNLRWESSCGLTISSKGLLEKAGG